MEVRALRDWLRSQRGVAWSERKCARVLGMVEIDLAQHRVLARRSTMSQMGLDEQRIPEAKIAESFAELRKMLAEVQP